ncbi:MAG: efflux RND transporter periplasmic adaptor subunit [Mizugakiibacter sp.]|uniref:efflux RND transporter periplasmic adaptor subunit n=1 Tax=Mizugakiibacter sp. TaxID=1972610 RepID=UPI0031BF4189|nr:efflux RND transporter periplasmic adaptor subunit [Xanthomonadaceae bacterium]
MAITIRRFHPSIVLIPLIFSMALGACGGGRGASDKDASAGTRIPVEAAVAGRAPIAASYSGTGTLEARGETDVVAKAGGVLLKLYVEEGEHVRKGQLLAQLDDASARASVAQSLAQMRKAEATYARAERAIQQQLIPRAEYDQDKYDLETQRAAYTGATLQLAYTRIEAPIDGVVSRRMVKLGNLIQPNQALFHVVDMEPLQVTLNVPEREFGTLAAGQPVKLAVDALPGKAFPGSVARIAPVVDAASGTFRVTCEFRDATRALKPGMFGRVDVVYDQRRDALVIPRSALIEEDGETAVFVVERGAPPKPVAPARGKPGEAVAAERKPPAAPTLVAKRRMVKIGYADGSRVEIRDGLKPGERVITIGRNAVRDGTEVQVLENAQ